jgi:hypothetical protein
MTTMGGAYNPLGVPGLLGWWSARAPLGLGTVDPADGTALASWADLSGNGRHLVQATGAAQPKYRNARGNLLTYAQATAEGIQTAAPVDTATIVTSRTTASVYATGARARSGTQSFSLAVDGTAWTMRTMYPPHGVAPGGTLSGHAAVYNGGTVAQDFVGIIEWATSAPSYLGATPPGPVVTVQPGTWGVVTVTGTVPASSTNACMRVDAAGAGAEAGVTHNVDEMGLYAGALPAAFLLPYTAPLGRMPGVQFAGAQFLNLGVPLWTVPSDATVYALITPDALPAATVGTVWAQETAAKIRLNDTGQIATLAGWTGASWATQTAPSSPTTLGAVTLSSTRMSATALTAARDSGSVNTAAGDARPMTGGAAGNGFAVGSHNGSSDLLRGVVHELAVYASAHDEGTMHRVERSLAAPYGLGLVA